MNAAPVIKEQKAPAITSQMQKVLDYIAENGQITDIELEKLLNVKHTRVFNLTREMSKLGLIRIDGRGKEKRYVRK